VKWLLLLLALAAAGVTARLGWWQLDRAAQKEQMQQRVDERRAQPPLTMADALPQRADAVAAVHDRLALLNGRWLPEHTVYLDNRPMEGRVGFFVVTPLQLADGSSVLVQRGWLPRDLTDRVRIRAPDTPAGEQRILGRIAPQLPRLYELGDSASGPIRQNLAIESFALETRLLLRPWVLIQEEHAGQAITDGLLRRWSAPASGVHKHYGYAFQWFSLSALIIGLYVWFQLIRPRRLRPA
jgi:surfeit locus 1 family protein